ncbi:MAG: toll/interleukin-1 receptor domain-containing protein [Bacteroidales bacterium]|nr:toll/interleukin-1 receptor domain-containing protein [Bacteroidales bacterium]
MIKNKIFISHSSQDIEIVKSFVEEILMLGLDIPAERIFCSGMEGQGLKSGQYIPDKLREEIKSSMLALLFISKNYKTSEVCLNELGAVWLSLEKEHIIPIILPDTKFTELGFLDINRIGIKINEQRGILKLIQDCKELLNPNFNIEKLHNKLEKFVTEVKIVEPLKKKDELTDDSVQCYENNLFALDRIIIKAIPAYNEGIHPIVDVNLQNRILTDLGNANFLKSFWYKMAEGDSYVERLQKLPSGNWLISEHNWEIKLTAMWVSMNSEPQYGFILIHSDKLEPYKINSDVGGESYYVGILKDGTIVSENEYLHGYAVIGGESIDIDKLGVEPMHRDKDPHWIFLVSSYHKAGFNADETIDFCKKHDTGEFEVNQDNIMKFLRALPNHPTVTRWR